MSTTATDWQHIARSSSALEVFLLGTVDVPSAIRLQLQLLEEVAGRVDVQGAVLVCQHPPTITIGREGSFADVLVERSELTSRQIDVHWTNRGGGTIVHSVGQVAVYPILPLDRLKLGLIEYRTRLERILVRAAEDLEVPAERAELAPGATCRCGQFGFIGAGVRSWVTNGGLFVNVSITQSELDLVKWTPGHGRVTSLSAQLLKPVSMSSVREALIRRLTEAFGYNDFQIHSGHPLLHRTTRKVYVFS